MPRSTKGIPRPDSCGPRPHVWKSGPDLVRHQQHVVWRQQKNQAQWRGEIYDLDFDTWCRIWGDLWPQRGRTRGTLCMTRLDWEAAWCESNVIIVPREQHSMMQGQAVRNGWRSLARRRQQRQQGTQP